MSVEHSTESLQDSTVSVWDSTLSLQDSRVSLWKSAGMPVYCQTPLTLRISRHDAML